MGAMLCTENAANAFTPGMHGTTFGGGPLACAVAIAVIDTMQKEDRLAHISEVGDFFQKELKDTGRTPRLHRRCSWYRPDAGD